MLGKKKQSNCQHLSSIPINSFTRFQNTFLKVKVFRKDCIEIFVISVHGVPQTSQCSGIPKMCKCSGCTQEILVESRIKKYQCSECNQGVAVNIGNHVLI